MPDLTNEGEILFKYGQNTLGSVTVWWEIAQSTADMIIYCGYGTGSDEFSSAELRFFQRWVGRFLGDPAKQEVPQEETASVHSAVRPSWSKFKCL